MSVSGGCLRRRLLRGMISGLRVRGMPWFGGPAGVRVVAGDYATLWLPGGCA